MTNHDITPADARKANQAFAAELRRIEAGGDIVLGFDCEWCFDTHTLDQGGREVACFYCSTPQVTIKLTGLAHGLGDTGSEYSTCSAHTSTTMTFTGSRDAILRDVAVVRIGYVQAARRLGRTGRNSISSGAIAVENRVIKALKGVTP